MEHCPFCSLSQEDRKWLLFESPYWSVYLSDRQDYIGRCIVVCNDHCESLSALETEQWADLHRVIKGIEALFKNELGAAMFNWTCLMNNAYQHKPAHPHVHFHFRPRFEQGLTLNGVTYPDELFGHHYENKAPVRVGAEAAQALFEMLKEKTETYFSQ